MTHGLSEANASARVTYHAQELSLLAAQGCRDEERMWNVKQALDEAFLEMLKGEYGSH